MKNGSAERRKPLPVPAQKSDAVLRARCDQSLKDRVIAFTSRRGRRESDLVREAVIEFLARKEAA